MTCVCRRYDVKKNEMAAVLQLKINNYISATRIPFFTKYFTWVFIRMCMIVTSSDMTSFIYIGDKKHHLSKKAWKEKEMTSSKKKLCYLY